MLSSMFPVAGGATLALMALSALAAPQKSSFWKLQSRQQQTAGTPLFLDEPSCDSYQCTVVYYPGDNATAHWLDAPSGNVNLTMREHHWTTERGSASDPTLSPFVRSLASHQYD